MTTHWLQRGTALTALRALGCPPGVCLNTSAIRMRQDGWMEPILPLRRASSTDVSVSIGKTTAAALSPQPVSETVDYFMYTNWEKFYPAIYVIVSQSESVL